MDGIAAQLLAQVRVAEGWSMGNLLGAILLVALLAGALWAALSVVHRR